MGDITKTAQPATVVEAVPDETAQIDLLKMEYTALLGLYTHTENTLFSIFNFYLTVLSALVGAIVVLIQINNTNLTNALPSISVLLILAILIGVIMQAAIVNKNIDLSIHTLGINLLKYRLFNRWPQEMSNIFFINNFWAKVHPIRPKKLHTTTRIHERFWWLFPMGTHQLFIGVINSLALAALVIMAIQQLLGTNAPIQSVVVAVTFVVLLSFEIQAIYARIKHRRGIDNLVAANGTDVVWTK